MINDRSTNQDKGDEADFDNVMFGPASPIHFLNTHGDISPFSRHVGPPSLEAVAVIAKKLQDQRVRISGGLPLPENTVKLGAFVSCGRNNLPVVNLGRA